MRSISAGFSMLAPRVAAALTGLDLNGEYALQSLHPRHPDVCCERGLDRLAVRAAPAGFPDLVLTLRARLGRLNAPIWRA
jgi:hypothetical protein